MEIIKIEKYKCEKCGALYSSSNEAKTCESRPITQDKGVKVGDVVYITSGEGIGRLAKIDEVVVISKDWGHYAWERYWHTVAVHASIIDDWGSRFLTFDSYVVPKQKCD